MTLSSRTDPEMVRTVNPVTWPQYPYDTCPRTPEQSAIRYGIHAETGLRMRLRDGVELVYDVFRPRASGQRFPALVAFSPYTRQLQQSVSPLGQNEAGLTEFWVPRGYAHVIVDVRGTNDSGGEWDQFGQVEQEDYAEVIEHVASQPWCTGRVGMTGCSYFGRAQNFAAIMHPPSLKATFPYDASCDLYRDAYFHGGIPNEGHQRGWSGSVMALNAGGGRVQHMEAIENHFQRILSLELPYDCDYYRERSSWPRLGQISVPSYFGSDWHFVDLHLRGTFQAWDGTPDIQKRMLMGPGPNPFRPFGAYHIEALRWYDQWLKDMDSQVMAGDPIRLYIQGDGRWRGEREWPLARTRWTEFYLHGASEGVAGSLDRTPGQDGGATFRVRPADPAWLRGQPRLVYRSAPLESGLELTGPMVLTLWASITAEDTDWLVYVLDELPDGTSNLLTKGWLRASHRAVLDKYSTPYRPWHPHTSESILPVEPGTATEYRIEVGPVCNVFRGGHRLRLEIASSDILTPRNRYNRAMNVASDNTVLEGRAYPSRILAPVIPQ